MPKAHKEHFDFLYLLIEEVYSLLNDPWRSGFAIEFKADSSPVTEFDRKVELRLRELISKRFPDHGIVGEEFGILNPDAEWAWVLDPIDGTKSFLSQIPLYTSLIALRSGEMPVLGAIVQPQLGIHLTGDGESAWLNKKKISYTPQSRDLADSVLLYTDIIDIERFQNLPRFLQLVRKVRFSRSWGDGFGYMQVCRNLAQIMIDPVMNEWDIMALIPVVTGAGLRITDYQGRPAHTGKSMVAAVPELHDAVLEILNND